MTEIAGHQIYRDCNVHDAQLARGPAEPTPIGVFRAVERPDYGSLVTHQLVAAADRLGPGDLGELLASGTTWTT